MKRLLICMVFCGAITAAAAEPIKARVKFDTTRTSTGTLEGRSGGSVIFRPNGGSPAGLPESRLNDIEFRIDGIDDISNAFEKKAYGEATELAEKILSPALLYLDLPGNLSGYVLQWMVATFWSGDFDRTAELAKALQGVADESLRTQADYYGRLARMEQRGPGEMTEFLKTPKAETVYPESSAARLYIQARLQQQEGSPLNALRTATRIIAVHGRDTDWMAQADLLCAELYYELDMPESAEAVLGDIQYFYTDNKGIQEKAAALAAKQK